MCRGQRLSGLSGLNRLTQNRVRARLQRLRDTGIISHDSQSQRSLAGLPLASCIQKKRRFGLVVPVDKQKLQNLGRNSFDRLSHRTVLCLNAEIGKDLTNRLSCSLIGGEQKATKGHAPLD